MEAGEALAVGLASALGYKLVDIPSHQKKDAEIARLTKALEAAHLETAPELPHPGSNTHHHNGNGNH